MAENSEVLTMMYFLKGFDSFLAITKGSTIVIDSKYFEASWRSFRAPKALSDSN